MNFTTSRKARFSRQSHTALAWGFGAFLVFQLGLALAIGFWWREIGDPECAYKKARLVSRYGKNTGPTTSVWMLGSSRTAFGFLSKTLEDRLARQVGKPAIAFNFGMVGAGPVTELVTLKRLLAEGIRPDLLLIEVLPPLLADQSSQPQEGHWLTAQRFRLSEVSLLEHYGLGGKKLRRNWFASLLVPWYSQRFCLLSRVMPTWLPWQLRKDWFRAIDDSGWVSSPQKVTTPEQRRHAVERAVHEYGPGLADFHLGGHTCEALEDTLALCRREGIRTTLVLMPEGTEFRSLYPPAVWDQIRTYLDKLCRQYQATVINGRAWVADEDFSDSHHLLPHGATVFTKRLGGEVLALLGLQSGARRGKMSKAKAQMPKECPISNAQ
jgi:hypothetical protein